MPRSGLTRRPQLADEVAAHLRNMIMSGEVRAGEFLRLDQIAADLGVSVTPVREALAALRGEDMVELEPRRGYVVQPLSRQDVEDMFAVQSDLACTLVGRATLRLTAEDVQRFTAINDDLLRAAEAADAAELERLEYEFHRAINLVAQSRKLSWLLRNVSVYLPQHFYSTDAEWRFGAVRSHKKLLRALHRGDVEAAMAETRKHVLDSGARLIAHLEKIGMWSQG
ncbi:GntR family transcriptional regulator [Amycolatopsis thermalba]|nr:GntR family transcriptional regulator [Amycolatopsis thermalba]